MCARLLTNHNWRYARSLRNQKLIFAPGTDFRYSNMAFEVLGDLIAKVSGESFDDYVQHHTRGWAGAFVVKVW